MITEREYFKCVKSADVHISFDRSVGLDPKSLVRNARNELKITNIRNPNKDFDELWCVFDVDEHVRYKEALSDARHSKVNVAVSNPCFELWLVLHERDHNSPVTRFAIQKQCEQLRLTDGKHISDSAYQQLKGKTQEAKKRAIELEKSHVSAGSDELANPSSSVWYLVDRLQEVP